MIQCSTVVLLAFSLWLVLGLEVLVTDELLFDLFMRQVLAYSQ